MGGRLHTNLYPKLHKLRLEYKTKIEFPGKKFACISFEFISTVLNLIFIRVIKKTLGNIPLAHAGV